MKLTAQCGCLFNDRVDLELSPSDLENLIDIAEERSLSSEDYDAVGLWRSKKDYLQSRFDAWHKARTKKDAKL